MLRCKYTGVSLYVDNQNRYVLERVVGVGVERGKEGKEGKKGGEEKRKGKERKK